MSLITSVIGGIMGGHAAGTAANAQVGAADQAAATVQNAASQGNAGIQNAGTAGQQAVISSGGTAASMAQLAGWQGAGNVASATGTAADALNPYAASGMQATSQLMAGLAPGGNLAQTFTAADMQANDPGYQFRLQQGQQALQRSLAASGGVQGGGAMKQLNDYAQSQASAEYQNAFSRFTTNQQNNVGNLQNLANAGQAASTTIGNQGIQANEYNAGLNQNAAQYGGNAGMQTNEYSAGLGYQSAATQAQMADLAEQYAGNTQLMAGNARAAGIMGKQNAYTGMMSGLGNAFDAGMSNL